LSPDLGAGAVGPAPGGGDVSDDEAEQLEGGTVVRSEVVGAGPSPFLLSTEIIDTGISSFYV
jgi:hypothetical protein